MNNLFVFILSVCLFFAGFGNSRNAFAKEDTEAKCAMLKFDQAFKNAKAVFIGEVSAVERDGDKRVFEFKVKKFWKGIEDTKVKVFAYENRRYQAPYKVGETFLVYAKDDEKGGLWDGRCSRSRNIDGYAPSLKEDLKSLGEGRTCISLSDNKKVADIKKRESK